MKPNKKQLAMVKKKDKMDAFKFAQVKYELNAKQRRALGEHPNYEEAMYYAYMGGCLTALDYWCDFEACVPDVLAMVDSQPVVL